MAFLRQVEELRKERLPERDVVSNISIESMRCLRDIGECLQVGQAEGVLDNLQRSLLEEEDHGGERLRIPKSAVTKGR